MLDVEVAPEASADLDEIAAYSESKFGPNVTALYMARLRQAIRNLARMPNAGRIRHEVNPPCRGLNCGQHRIYYDVETRRVYVLRVLHQVMLAETRVRH